MSGSPFGLAGRVAVVTGGYGVIGGAIASGLARAGAAVAILGRRRDAAEAKAQAIRDGGGGAPAPIADGLAEGPGRAPPGAWVAGPRPGGHPPQAGGGEA